jgi:hypothetical protein
MEISGNNPQSKYWCCPEMVEKRHFLKGGFQINIKTPVLVTY